MKRIYIIIAGISLAAACSTPGPITGRPDPNVSTSGTLGSVKATNGPPPQQMSDQRARDSAEHKRDTGH